MSYNIPGEEYMVKIFKIKDALNLDRNVQFASFPSSFRLHYKLDSPGCLAEDGVLLRIFSKQSKIP